MLASDMVDLGANPADGLRVLVDRRAHDPGDQPVLAFPDLQITAQRIYDAIASLPVVTSRRDKAHPRRADRLDLDLKGLR